MSDPTVCMSTDISSILGAIFIGNLSMITSGLDIPCGSGIVVGSTFSGCSS